MRKLLAPTESLRDGRDEGTTLSHPAFGVLTVGKSHGGAGRYFGSDLQHHSAIRIEVREATMDRNLSTDWVHAGKLLVEFSMTEAQWARVVSSIGDGSGTPITLEGLRGPDGGVVMLPGIAEPKLTRAERHGDELKRSMQERLARAMEALEALERATHASSPKKSELRALASEAAHCVRTLPGTVGFIMDTFTEKMEDVQESAKIEIDAYMVNLATRTGWEALKQAAPVIPGREPVAELVCSTDGDGVKG